MPTLRGKGYIAPWHLKPLLDELEKIMRGEQVRIVCHTPPRGAKSETLLASIGWFLSVHPDWEMAYCSYNATQARSRADRGRIYAKDMGIELARDATIEWRTPQGGGCIARGVGEGITGQGVDVAIVDDPVKDRAEAESQLKRDRAWDWFNEALYTRGNPNLKTRPKPRSIIVNMARWHPDDLAGRLIKQGWKYIKLPALTEMPDGTKQSFWPEGWPVESLEETQRQLGPYAFASLYQGDPRPRGGAVFGDPWVYETKPAALRIGMGLDLAYSKKTSSDWSVLVVMGRADWKDEHNQPRHAFYVLDVVRTQQRAPEFTEVVKRYRNRYPGARVRWYGSGIETEGVASFMRPGLPYLEALQATADKFIRAQKYAAAWNQGLVLLPEQQERDARGVAIGDKEPVPWLDQFIDEHVNFTGVADAHDDVVDAAVAAFDVLNVPRETRPEKEEPLAPRRM